MLPPTIRLRESVRSLAEICARLEACRPRVNKYVTRACAVAGGICFAILGFQQGREVGMLFGLIEGCILGAIFGFLLPRLLGYVWAFFLTFLLFVAGLSILSAVFQFRH